MPSQFDQIRKFKQPFQVTAFYGFRDAEEREPVLDYFGGYRPDKSRRKGRILVTKDDIDHIIADVLEMYKSQITEDIRSLCITDKNWDHIVELKHPQDFIDDNGNVRYEVDKTIN